MNRNKHKISLQILLTLCLLAFTAASVLAVPSYTGVQELTQPTGQKFNATQYGDEWLNWVATDDGDVIIQDTDKFWKYAELKTGELKPGKTKYKIHASPKSTLKVKDVKSQVKKNKLKPKIHVSAATQSISTQSLAGTTQKTLVLLVQFSGTQIKNSDSVWNNQFYGTTGSTVNNYYKEVSGGSFYFTPVQETAGLANDGIIKVTLNYPHPNTGSNTGYANQKIVQDALTAADPYINYSNFDTDGNGSISANELHIVTIVAGYEAAYGGAITPSVWGHRWSTSVNLDGKYLSNYTQQGELHLDHMATIGILCHELGHDLGLPDLYDYDYSSNGVGIHSIMAGGSWAYQSGYAGNSPTHMDAWSKTALGFANPAIVNSSGSYTVNSANTNQYNVLKIPTSNKNEYFLVENRQFAGFDIGLANTCRDKGGIAIWHIDESILNGWAPNNNEAHKGVDLEESNEGLMGYSQLDTRRSGFYVGNNYYVGYAHYYYTGNTSTIFKNTSIFSPTSTPSSKLYDGTNTQITINSPNVSSNSMAVNISLPNVATGETTISYNLSENAATNIAIYDSASNLVKNLLSNAQKYLGANSTTWDGRDSSGNVVQDGTYTYIINATDQATLSADPASGPIIVNNSPAITAASDSPDPFSPTGSNVCTIKYTLPKTMNLTLKIYNNSNNIVKTLVDGTANSGINTATWNGKNESGTIVSSGVYIYKINGVDSAGMTANEIIGTITVDLTAPVISAADVSPNPFAPTGDNSAAITYTLSESAQTTITIYNSSNSLIRTIQSSAAKPSGSNTVTWDGKNSAGDIVQDGTYSVKITAVDKVGLSATPMTINFMVKQAYPSITSVSASPNPFAPDMVKSCSIKYTLSKNSTVLIKLYDDNNTLVKTLLNQAVTAGNNAAAWDGYKIDGSMAEDGIYTYKISAADSQGRTSDTITGTITVDTLPPVISGGEVDIDPFEPIE